MRKFINWFLKEVNGIGILLIILIVPLYIIYLGKYIDDKTVDILIAIAAIVSTCFLYLAFLESRLSNKLKIIEPKFNQFEKDITDLEKKSNECIFSDAGIKLLSDKINYPDFFLKAITHTKFNNELAKVFIHLKENTKYGGYLRFFGDSERAYINDDKLQDICSGLSRIYIGISNITSYYSNVYSLYFNIDKSDLLIDHKQFLFNKLRKLTYEYETLNNNITTNNETGKTLKEFVMLDTDDHNGVTKLKMVDFDFLILLFKEIEKIKINYKNTLLL